MKFISWNVNGLRAVCDKGFREIFSSLDADFFCLQETKMQAGQLDLQFDGYQSYWNYADKKGYSGTAIFTRHQPLNVSYGLGIDEHDHEGRVITLEFEDFYFITVYVPNSQDELKRLDFRMEFETDLVKYLNRLNEKKPIVYTGDLNVAHNRIDLKNPDTNTHNAGFTKEERDAFTNLLSNGYVDVWRALHPEEVKYSMVVIIILNVKQHSGINLLVNFALNVRNHWFGILPKLLATSSNAPLRAVNIKKFLKIVV